MKHSRAIGSPPDAARRAPRSAGPWLRTIALAAVVTAGAACSALLFAGEAPARVAPEAVGAPFLYACEDGRDNDGDGKIDYPADPGCQWAEDQDETDPPPSPPPPPPPPPPPGALPQCSDGVDNDGDLVVDMDDVTGCTSPTDNNEGDDVYDLGVPGYTFMRADETGATLTVAGSTGCSWLGGERNRHGVGGKLWSFKVIARFCWNGKVVTRLDNVQRWVDAVGFPLSLIYPVSWHIESESVGPANVSTTSVFEQAEVKSCVSKTHVCLTEHPWIRFVMSGTGAAACSTDIGPIPSRDCRG